MIKYLENENDNLNPILRKIFGDGYTFYGIKEKNELELLNINHYATSMPCIFGRHRWACACPVKRASDAMIIAIYFLMVSVLEVRDVYKRQ